MIITYSNDQLLLTLECFTRRLELLLRVFDEPLVTTGDCDRTLGFFRFYKHYDQDLRLEWDKLCIFQQEYTFRELYQRFMETQHDQVLFVGGAYNPSNRVLYHIYIYMQRLHSIQIRLQPLGLSITSITSSRQLAINLLDLVSNGESRYIYAEADKRELAAMNWTSEPRVLLSLTANRLE